MDRLTFVFLLKMAEDDVMIVLRFTRGLLSYKIFEALTICQAEAVPLAVYVWAVVRLAGL